MKIVVASMIHETCSFNNAVKTTMEEFKANYFKLGAEVVDVPPNEWVIGGFVAAMKPRNVQLEGIFAVDAFASGELSAATFAELRAMLLSGLRKAAPFDA